MSQVVQIQKKAWVEPTLDTVDVRETLAGFIASPTEGFITNPQNGVQVPGPGTPGGSFGITRNSA